MELYHDIDLQDCPLCHGPGLIEEEEGWCLYVACLDCGCRTAELPFSSPEERLAAAKQVASLWNMGKVIHSGAVGDFFYRRLLGIEPKQPGYKAFTVEPVFFDEIPSCKGSLLTPYGRIAVSYDRKEGHIEVLVPANTRCTLLLDGERKELTSGRHRFELTR